MNILKILLIEDSPGHRDNLFDILTLKGYTVGTAENGKIGVEKALKEKPDLIICDVMMPELDGYGVLQILGNNQKTADIPFIYLTALSERDDFRRGMSLGADDYITKPFDVTQLLQTIERRLHKSERLRKASTLNAPFEGFVNEAKALEMMENLSSDRELRHFQKKDIVYAEGEHPRYLYYLEKGTVKLFKSNEEGREYIINIAGPGTFLGYLCLHKNDKHTESVTVLEPSDIRLIPMDEFHSLVFSNRDVNARFIKLLANHVAEQEQMLLELAYNSVRKRVASALILLHDQGKNNIHFQRDDLAAIVGTAKETLVRTLSGFKVDRLIDISNGQIIILKPDKLRQMPN
jgi:CRP/FNR family transcriptional regulator, polysaccharide utilization system transcription regulator